VSSIYLHKLVFLKRPEEKTSDALAYVYFFFCCGSFEVWWGLILDVEMTDLIVSLVTCLSRWFISNSQGFSDLTHRKEWSVTWTA